MCYNCIHVLFNVEKGNVEKGSEHHWKAAGKSILALKYGRNDRCKQRTRTA